MRTKLADIPPVEAGRIYTVPEAALVTRYCTRVIYDEIAANKLQALPASGRGRKLIMGEALLQWLRAPAKAEAA